MAQSAKVAAIRAYAQEHRDRMTTDPEYRKRMEDEIDDDAKAREESLRAEADKVRENRLRRMADRQGLRVHKSRRRDPRAVDYGGYLITDDRNRVVQGDSSYPLDLDDVEKYLTT